jgi:gliding motility-associated-like protein
MTKKLLFSTIIQKSIVVFLLLITGFVNGQTTYDFTTNATLSYGAGGYGIWNTQANITIGGVAYKLTCGGNGSFTNSSTGGVSNGKCLMKDGSGGDQFTLERVDGQPFQFYEIWVKHQSMNSYSQFYTLPPWYTLNASGAQDQYGNSTTMYTYQDMTAMSAGANSLTNSTRIINSGSGGVTVTSVQISFQAIIYFWIDDIKVGPPSIAVPTVTSTAASSVSNTSATLGGNVTSDGGASITERGVVWSTVSNPTVTDNKAANGSGLGTFSGTINSLPPGTTIHYRAYATNSAGTSYGTDMTFTTTSVLGATQSQTNIACNGGSNGSATVTASGGNAPYTYSWSPSGGTGVTASGLAAGTYTCTITDNSSVSITKTFTITQPVALSATAASQTNVSCNGGSNGTATVLTTGGAGGYTYSWSPSGGTGATASGLSAGTYTVTVTDANSCQATRSFTITQPTALSATAASQTNVSCNGGSNGTATVLTTGGAGGYTYSWSPFGGTSAIASGLSAGTYTVTVTDANSCQATRSFAITQPTALVATAASQTNIACNGGSNGSATVSVIGGTPGYTYSWSPSGGTGAIATGLVAGIYTCTVTDANGCSNTSQSFTITQPVAIPSPVATMSIDYCKGATATALTATALSGNTLKWYIVATGGSSSTTPITPITTTTGSTNYYVAQENNSGCESPRTTISVVVNPTAILSGNNTVELSTSSTLIATTSPSSSNAWVSSNPSIATISNSGLVNGLALGSTTITYTNNYGCTTSSVISVIVGTTQTPVLTSPLSNTTGATTLLINYTLPEAPLAGSVRLLFTPTAGGTPIIWTMNNSTAANFAYVVGSNPTTISNVVSGSALAFTTYNVTLSYQDANANPVANVTNTNIQTLAPPSISLPQTNYTGVVNGNFPPFTIQNTGGVATYTIAPALPNGLTINTVTGEISGRPTVPLANNTTFTITASNAAGTTTISFRLFIDQDTDGDGILNAIDTDDDGDGVLDGNDAFPLNRLEWTDTDHDGIGDNTDTDDDNDGILDTCDADINGDGIPDNGTDIDRDGIKDSCDLDMDGDGVNNISDNCPIISNANQADRDHDGKGDVCDTDELNISEAITPNGDGINDTWVIYNIENHPGTIVRVFNRWGKEVFYAIDYKNDWDGHYRDYTEKLPSSGSYSYQIDLGGDGSIDIQGWLYITK